MCTFMKSVIVKLWKSALNKNWKKLCKRHIINSNCRDFLSKYEALKWTDDITII